MAREVSCDVWHEGSNRAVYETTNLTDAKSKMREYWIHGKRGIRMYAYYSAKEFFVACRKMINLNSIQICYHKTY